MFKNLLKKLFNPQPTELISPLASPKPKMIITQKGYGGIKPAASSAPVQMPNRQINNTGVPMPSPTVQNNGVPMATPRPHTDNGVMYGRNPSTKIANPNVRSAIERAAKQYGVPAALLMDIAMQESTLNPDARNPEPGVTASGLFQFNNGTWDTVQNYGRKAGSTLKLPTNDRMDAETSAAAAAYLIKNGQLGRWDASKNVWGKFWPDDELNQNGYYSQTLKRVANAR